MGFDVNGVNFRSNVQANSPVDLSAQQRFQRTEPLQTDTFEKQEKDSNKNKKIAAGILGTAAAIGLAIFFIRRGRKSNAKTGEMLENKLTFSTDKDLNEMERKFQELKDPNRLSEMRQSMAINPD